MMPARVGRPVVLLVTLIAAAAAAACASTSATPSASRIARAVEVSAPGCRLELEEHIHLGRFTLALVRGVLRLTGDADSDEAALLHQIHRVEVASYRVHPGSGNGLPRSLKELERVLAIDGMVPVVRERDSDRQTWVLAKDDGRGGLSELMVVDLDDDALEVVRLEGHIDRLLARAVELDPDAAAAMVRKSASHTTSPCEGAEMPVSAEPLSGEAPSRERTSAGSKIGARTRDAVRSAGQSS